MPPQLNSRSAPGRGTTRTERASRRGPNSPFAQSSFVSTCGTPPLPSPAYFFQGSLFLSSSFCPFFRERGLWTGPRRSSPWWLLQRLCWHYFGPIPNAGLGDWLGCGWDELRGWHVPSSGRAGARGDFGCLHLSLGLGRGVGPRCVAWRGGVRSCSSEDAIFIDMVGDEL